MAEAFELDDTTIGSQADSNAEGFYRCMAAMKIGEVSSTVKDRERVLRVLSV